MIQLASNCREVSLHFRRNPSSHLSLGTLFLTAQAFITPPHHHHPPGDFAATLSNKLKTLSPNLSQTQVNLIFGHRKTFSSSERMESTLTMYPLRMIRFVAIHPRVVRTHSTRRAFANLAFE